MMHDGQLAIDAELAGELIAREFPHLRDLAVTTLGGSGTVNSIFRVGENITARFPLETTSIAELDAEASGLAELADASPFPAPRPLGLGAGDKRYPSAWSLQTWIPGATADPFRPVKSDEFTEDLGTLILALRATPVGDRVFDGKGRGGVLSDHDAWMAHCIVQSTGIVDVSRVSDAWAWLREAPRSSADVMSHRDLTPANLLVADGRLVGVLDGGSFGPADPSLDLVCAWHLLEQSPRRRLRKLIGASDSEWLRGAAWALQQAMGLVWYYRDSNPVMAELGRSTVRRVLSDPDVVA